MKIIKSITLFFFLLVIPRIIFSQIRNYEIGSSVGFGALVIEQHSPSLFIPKTSVSFGYHPDLKHGLLTGISYSNSVEGCDEVFEIPLFYSYKSKSERNHGVISASSFSELIFQIIGQILPHRVEFCVGPTLGYINRNSDYLKATSSNNQYYSDEFIADRKISLSFDIYAKPSYAIGPVNIYLGFGVGYLITKNFKFVSDDPFLSGKRPCFNVKGDVGLSISF